MLQLTHVRKYQFFKPFNLLGQAQQVQDDYDEPEVQVIDPVASAVLEDVAPLQDKSSPPFILFEAPVQMSNPIYNLAKKAKKVLFRLIRSSQDY